jgi:hypothetical protein
MKLPAQTAVHGLHRIEPAEAYPPATVPYRLSYCTSALYATDQTPGHSFLKHCFLRIDNGRGDAEFWSIGRGGLGSETYPDTASTRCSLAAIPMSEAQKSALLGALAAAANRGYRWGGNDCCSALAAAHRQVLGSEAPLAIREAARDLAASPEVFP